MLFEEKVAKRFSKLKPADFDFWAELDDVLKYALFIDKENNPRTIYNFDKAACALAYIFLCFGMYNLKSTICAVMLPKVIQLSSRDEVEATLTMLEHEKRKKGP